MDVLKEAVQRMLGMEVHDPLWRPLKRKPNKKRTKSI